jgi:hypothetical protein
MTIEFCAKHIKIRKIIVDNYHLKGLRLSKAEELE